MSIFDVQTLDFDGSTMTAWLILHPNAFYLWADLLCKTAPVAGLPGDLYLRMLKAAILPLIVSSIITGKLPTFHL